MKPAHALKGKIAVVIVALGVFLGFGGVALATTSSFGYTLPGYQENVTLASGTRASSSTSAAATVTANNNNQKFWLWCDSGSVGNRLTNSVLVTGKTTYYLTYWNTGSGKVCLRGCTDGWQTPNYVGGSVTF